MSIARAFPVFSAAFAVIYLACVQYNLAPFTYHAELMQWGLGAQPPRQGPAMYWYGWLTTSTLGATAVAALSLAVPASLAKRVWSGFVWLIPLGVIAVFVYILRGYFLR
jgi:hypothetical protein